MLTHAIRADKRAARLSVAAAAPTRRDTFTASLRSLSANDRKSAIADVMRILQLTPGSTAITHVSFTDMGGAPRSEAIRFPPSHSANKDRSLEGLVRHAFSGGPAIDVDRLRRASRGFITFDDFVRAAKSAKTAASTA